MKIKVFEVLGFTLIGAAGYIFVVAPILWLFLAYHATYMCNKEGKEFGGMSPLTYEYYCDEQTK